MNSKRLRGDHDENEVDDEPGIASSEITETGIMRTSRTTRLSFVSQSDVDIPGHLLV